MSENAEIFGSIWRDSPNFDPGRDGNEVVAICNHIMASSMGSADSWFLNSKSKVSAHFGIGKTGTIYQWVRTGDVAYANGIMNQPDTSIPWIADCVKNELNPNKVTVSIEHEGQPNDTMPEAQYQASLAVQKYLVSKFNIPVDRQHIIGHYNIDKVNRPYCPGPGYPWDRLMKDLGAYMAQPPAAKPESIQLNGFTLGHGFLDYFQENGGVKVFGLPLTEEFKSRLSGLTTQVLERVVLEYDPTADPDWRVRGLDVGRYWLEHSQPVAA